MTARFRLAPLLSWVCLVSPLAPTLGQSVDENGILLLLDDHVPHVVGDTPWGHRSRAYAIGYLQGLLRMLPSDDGAVQSA